MNRSLFLLRHGQSADKQSGQTDHSRELTATGRQHATALGHFLQERKYFFDVVVCSSAIRTKQTLEHILSNRQLMHTDQLIFSDDLYHGAYQDYYNSVINFKNQNRSVLIVGHNPSISELSVLLLKNPPGAFSPGSFAELQFESESWQNLKPHSGNLITFRNPED